MNNMDTSDHFEVKLAWSGHAVRCRWCSLGAPKYILPASGKTNKSSMGAIRTWESQRVEHVMGRRRSYSKHPDSLLIPLRSGSLCDTANAGDQLRLYFGSAPVLVAFAVMPD